MYILLSKSCNSNKSKNEKMTKWLISLVVQDKCNKNSLKTCGCRTHSYYKEVCKRSEYCVGNN